MTGFIVKTISQRTDGVAAQGTDLGLFERSEAPIKLTVELIAAYVQQAIGNGVDISFGTTVPSNLSGRVGDVFFDIGAAVIWEKDATQWANKLNLVSDAELTTALAQYATTAALTTAIANHAATDSHPIYLTQAEATALYKPLTTDDSVATGLRFALKTTQAGTPNAGEIQFNNSALANVTQLLISESGRDGSSIPTLLDMLESTTRIIIQVEQSEGLYAWFNVNGAPADSGTYRTVPVAFVTAPTGVTTVANLGASAAELTLDFYGVAGSGGGSLIVEEIDGSPSFAATTLRFPNGTVTPNGKIATISIVGAGRDLLAASRTYFISPTGAGAQDGSDAANAFTPAQARTKLTTLDLNGFNVTLQFVDGTYSNFSFILVPLVGSGKVFLTGNTATPANCVLAGSGADVIATDSSFDTVYEINGFTLQNASGNCIFIQNPGILRTRKLRYSSCQNVHLATQNKGSVQILEPYEIAGNADIHVYAVGFGSEIAYNYLENPPRVIQVASGLTMNTFAYCTIGGTIGFYNTYTQFSSTNIANCKKFVVESNGIIQTAGAGQNYLPGNIAGTQATQGQYL